MDSVSKKVTELTSATSAQTMSSREIAELVESRHDSVKRSMETLRYKGVISFTQSVETSHDGAGARPVEVYLVNKRDSYVVVAQLSPEFTARLVDRWQELEEKATKFDPAVLSRMDILKLAMESEEARIKAESEVLALTHVIEGQKPAVEFVERYVSVANGDKGFREVCKILKANEARFREFLSAERIMYKLGGSWAPYQNHIDAGRFIVRTGMNETNNRAYTTALFTPKGFEWVAGEWTKFSVVRPALALQ